MPSTPTSPVSSAVASKGAAQMAQRIKGSCTALITPFKDGKVDAAGFKRFVEWQISQGTDGLVPVGTTGEAPTLSHEEHGQVIELCVKAAQGRVPVIAGAGSNSTAEAIELTRFAKSAGADAVLHSTGYYNKPTQEGLYRHFKAINDAVDLPFIVYNVPVRTIVDISAATMARISELKNFAGIKDATAQVARETQHRLMIRKPYAAMSGEDATALGYNAHGGTGCISVTSNIAPKLCAAFQKACAAGDYKAARALHEQLMPLHDALFIETNPAPVKYAAFRLGLIESPECRLPLAPVTDATQKVLDGVLAKLGLLTTRAAE